MSAKIKALVSEIKAMQEKMRVEGKALFQEAFSDFFAKHPLAKSVRWSQFTPYFNDGDACEFGRNEACLELDLTKFDPMTAQFLREHSDDRYEGHDEYLPKIVSRPTYYTYPEGLRTELTLEETAVLADFKDLTKQLWQRELSSLFLDLFGDHVQVTVNAEGVTTEEYDHE